MEKVNRVIGHHGSDTSQKMIRAQARGLSQAPKAANILTKQGKSGKQLAMSKRFEEDKAAAEIEEEKSRSFRAGAEMSA